MSRRKRSDTPIKLVLLGMIVAIIAATGLLIKLCLDLASPLSPSASVSQSGEKPSKKPAKTPTEPTEETQPPLEVVSTASVGVQGDLLMHRPIIQACKQEDGSYDFSPVFHYTAEYTAALDYAIANLETTLAGPDQPYQGYPAHNSPDTLADAAKEAGFDMLLTANNHCNDTLRSGLERTLAQLRQRGLEPLGTRLSQEDQPYTVVDVNGIRIGMICYTYAMGVDGKGVCMNGANTYVEIPTQINYFTNDKSDKLISEIRPMYDAMLAEGAEATVLFIHWGEEYSLSEDATQRSIAQQICDIGFDVIVGGHPHVVQPMDLLTSTQDPDHKTVCVYSVGNAISNQFVDQMKDEKTGHTEDGMLFTMNFEKYSDGSVYLRSVEVLPTWAVRQPGENGTNYSMVPLEDSRRDQWQTLYNLDGAQLTGANDSYSRTMALVSAGLQKANDYLSQRKALRDSAV